MLWPFISICLVVYFLVTACHNQPPTLDIIYIYINFFNFFFMIKVYNIKGKINDWVSLFSMIRNIWIEIQSNNLRLESVWILLIFKQVFRQSSLICSNCLDSYRTRWSCPLHNVQIILVCTVYWWWNVLIGLRTTLCMMS
jgi:hypothetical protein